MNSVRLKDGHNAFHVLYVVSFLFSLSLSIPLYINSTFLSQFATDNTVGILYTLGSVVTIFGFSALPKFLDRFGNFAVILSMTFLAALLMAGLAFTKSFLLIAPMFVVYSALLSLIFMNFDVFLESYSTNDKTGGIRGSFLTMLNIAVIISPATAGFILTNGDYWKIYSLGAFFMLLVFALISSHFKEFTDPVYKRTPFWESFKELFARKNIYNIFMANVLLRFFYAIMVIYSPLYLHKYIGFEWNEIGIIFTIMLLPFILLEIPAGRLADNKWGEKEFLSIGFLIMGLGSIGLVFIEKPEVWIWATALFVTRIGASLVEIMTESYFFKQIDASDTHVMGFYRNARPLAYIIAPIIASVAISFIPFKFLFLILGMVMLAGLRYSLALEDTK